MDNKLIEMFDTACLVNDDMIKTQPTLLSLAILISPKFVTCPIPLLFRNPLEKHATKLALKKTILESGTKSYIVIFDAKLTKMEKDSKNITVDDASIRHLYTPNEVILEIVIYKDKKIISKERKNITDFDSYEDDWNVWGKSVEENEFTKKYNKFKHDNPDKF